jgi:uncharacterized protein with von Willebrand factor type A (vWA) domain
MKLARVQLAGVALLVLHASGGTAQDRGSTQTQVFGVTGRGARFVYVFDRSLSMKGAPLAAAKRELLASVKQLQRVHQFQIIFYNEKPRIMQPGQMQFADDNGQKQAESFVTSVTADGGTDHLAALRMALKLSPDVIFLLTDADEPPLGDRDLEEIRRANNGAVIHVIEFKSGAATGAASSLHKVAEQNRGEYKAIDIKSF